MSELRILGGRAFVWDGEIPGDKSITHRAFLMGACARGPLRILGALEAADTHATLAAVEQLGTVVERVRAGEIKLQPAPWRAPPAPLDCGNSGTTMRLLSGLLAAHPFAVELTGDDSLRRRPMQRIIDPLSRLGARIEGQQGCAPLRIRGGALRAATRHELPVASAQVKSAILLAALRAGVDVQLREPGPSRDHTERLLAAAGRPLRDLGEGWLELAAGEPSLELPPTLRIPGDPSSAAFLWVAAAATGGSVTTAGVGINPTRTGVLDVLRQAGARVRIDQEELVAGEPVARVQVEGGELRPFEISGDAVVRAVDELPVLGVLAAVAPGRSSVREAGELRVKESDRIAAICAGLSAFGVQVEELPDGFLIDGGRQLQAATVSARGDHRVAMAHAVAGLCARGRSTVVGADCIEVSFPGFAHIIGADQEGRSR